MMVTREADYAVRIVLFLASRKSDGKVVSSLEMAQEMDIPYRFLRNIIRRLVERGLVESRRGKGGGVRLAQPVASISLHDVLCAIDPTMTRLNICLELSHTCSRKHKCTVHPELERIQRQLDDGLREVSFDTLV